MAEHKNALDAGRDVVARLNPPLEGALAEKYDALVPDFAESLVEWAYGRHYARPNLDLKTRQLCTISALTVLGGQTAPQLKITIKHTLAAGATREEIIEAIWQMAVYGGLPAAINGLNAAQELFDELGATAT